MDATTYQAFVLPRDLSAEMVCDFAAMNRTLLHNAPTHILFRTQELRQTDEEWAQYAKQDGIHFIVCTTNGGYPTAGFQSSKWVGIAIVKGPLSSSEYNYPKPIFSDLQPDDKETRWRILRLFMRPSHRKLEAYRCILDASLRHICATSVEHICACTSGEQDGLGQMRIRTQAAVAPDNSVLAVFKAEGYQHIADLSSLEGLQFQGILTDVTEELLRDGEEETAGRVLIECVFDQAQRPDYMR